MTKVVTIIFAIFLNIASNKAQNAPPITEDEIKPCEALGYCEKVPNYPTDLIDQLVKKAGDSINFYNKTVPQQRRRRASGHTPLCKSETKVIIPQAMRDVKDNWVWVVNTPYMEQLMTVELCVKDKQACSDIVTTQEGYISECVQKYVHRIVNVVHPGVAQIGASYVKIPSCCQCAGHCSDGVC